MLMLRKVSYYLLKFRHQMTYAGHMMNLMKEIESIGIHGTEPLASPFFIFVRLLLTFPPLPRVGVLGRANQRFGRILSTKL
jgi:hypothetical protein